MIELSELIKQMDEIIERNNGVFHGGTLFFGELVTPFHGGYRKPIYYVNQTKTQGKETTKAKRE